MSKLPTKKHVFYHPGHKDLAKEFAPQRLAKGGKVQGPPTLVGETDHTFTVARPDGTKFTVAKRGLTKAYSDKIKKFARGGEVQKMSTGGVAGDALASLLAGTIPAVPPQPVTPVTDDPALMDQAGISYDVNAGSPSIFDVRNLLTPEARAERDARETEQAKAQVAADMEKAAADEKRAANPPPPSWAYTGPQAEPSAPKAEKRGAEGTAQATTSKEPPPFPTDPWSRAMQSGAGVSSQHVTRVPLGRVYTPPVKEIPRQYPDATEAAIEMFSIKSQDMQSKIQKTLEDANKRDTEIAKERDDEIAGREARAQQLRTDVEQGKIDPRAYYNRMSTGERIGSAIAVALGGLAAGLRGDGKNHALELIMREVDMDVDAQTKMLGHKQTILSNYLSETKRLSDAKDKTRIDLLAQASNQVHALEAGLKGEEERKNATLLKNAIDEKRRDESLKIAMHNSDLKSRDNQVNAQLMIHELQKEGMKAEAQQKWAQERAGRIVRLPVDDSAPKEVPRFMEIKPGIDASDTAKIRQEVDAGFMMAAETKTKLKRLASLFQKDRHGLIVPGERKAEAAQLQKDIIKSYAAALEGKRMSDMDMKFYAPMMADLEGITVFDSYAEGQLRGFGRLIDDRVNSMIRQYGASFPPGGN